MVELAVWSLLLSLLMAVVYRTLGKKPADLRALKARSKELKQRADAAKKAGNQEEANKLLTEMLSLSHEQMKGNMKPMLVSLLVFGAALWWFAREFVALSIPLPFTIPLIGPAANWFWWYLLITVPATVFFRKLLGMDAA